MGESILVHRQYCLWRSLFISLCLGALFFVYASLSKPRGNQNRKFSPPLPLPLPLLNTSYHSDKEMDSQSLAKMELGIRPEEWTRMQRALDWPSPDLLVTNLAMSTCPNRTTFSIVGWKESYKVGDKLYVNILAKDYNNVKKRYGGDFFQAKLYSSAQKASVFGDISDHRNGLYSVRFLLPWVGQAKVAVRLVHSSEAVQVFKKHRDSSVARVMYAGQFEGFGPDGRWVKEVVPCHLKWGNTGSGWSSGNCCCDYRDPRTGNEWQCQIPQNLPCDAWVYHKSVGYAQVLSTFEESLVARIVTNRNIQGDDRVINILPFSTNIDVRVKCQPGLQTLVPSGFYLSDVWTSFVCNTSHFPQDKIEKCLSNKVIYMIGDSTLRQWFEYLQRVIPGLTQVDLHTRPKIGPLMAIHSKSNIIVHWRFHGLPIHLPVIPAAVLHYISNEIDDLMGGQNTVIVFDIFAHLVFHPLDLYIHRVAMIRKAVLSLLRRAPETTVVIKSANTGSKKDVYENDWLYMQMDTVLREIFRGIHVVFIDVWQMTSCHYSTEVIHPVPVIIANEIDMFLSYLCPI